MARERLRVTSLRKVTAFLHDLYRYQNADQFSTALVTSLARLVPAEVYSYNELNPAQHHAVYKYAPHDFSVLPQGMEILGQFIHQHPYTQYMAATGDGTPHTITDFVSFRKFQQTDLYQEFYHPMRIPYQLSMGVNVQDSSGALLVLGLHRSGRDFFGQDKSVLALVRPHIFQAFMNARLVTQLEAQSTALQQVAETHALGVLILTTQHTILWGTSRALALMELCPGWNPRHPDQLPTDVLDWVCRIDAAFGASGEPLAAPTPLELDYGGHHLRLRLLRRDGHRIIVLEEAIATVTPDRLISLGLSKRETEVLAWAAQGKTNEEIGDILGCRLRTVKKHLERIYLKLGVENRTAAARLVHETVRSARVPIWSKRS